MIRLLIVDDERLSRQKVRAFAEAHADLEVVGECANGAEAVDAIRELEPDLVFLDIRMPRMDGFEVVRRVPRQELPRIVFVTAHAEYAVEAFDVEAVDYLLKPFDRARFDRTIERVRRDRQTETDAAVRMRLLDALERLDGAAAGRWRSLSFRRKARSFSSTCATSIGSARKGSTCGST